LGICERIESDIALIYILIDQPENIISVAYGSNFSVILTDDGRIFFVGSLNMSYPYHTKINK